MNSSRFLPQLRDGKALASANLKRAFAAFVVWMVAMREISNHELIADRIPAAAGHQRGLIRFAHTFNGYTFLDGADPSEQFRANWADLSLSELRCLLFLYVRADRWDGGMSTDWSLMWDLVAAIRARVEAGELD